jgi:zinc/manganese transport system substrate-binding protein
VSVIIRAAYEDPRPSQFVSEKSGAPAVMLPFTVGGVESAKDLVSLYDETLRLLLEAQKK